ncbi:hypothetical protein BC826DRAFT_544149 [Russula brevipes]|nr:hypothetical protein BC826DRAFT_544149 [Russula brevipes]
MSRSKFLHLPSRRPALRCDRLLCPLGALSTPSPVANYARACVTSTAFAVSPSNATPAVLAASSTLRPNPSNFTIHANADIDITTLQVRCLQPQKRPPAADDRAEDSSCPTAITIAQPSPQRLWRLPSQCPPLFAFRLFAPAMPQCTLLEPPPEPPPPNPPLRKTQTTATASESNTYGAATTTSRPQPHRRRLPPLCHPCSRRRRPPHRHICTRQQRESAPAIMAHVDQEMAQIKERDHHWENGN